MAVLMQIEEETPLPLFEQIPRLERIGPYTTIHGASLILGISENRISRLVQKKELKSRKIGWQWLLHREAFDIISRLLANEN